MHLGVGLGVPVTLRCCAAASVQPWAAPWWAAVAGGGVGVQEGSLRGVRSSAGWPLQARAGSTRRPARTAQQAVYQHCVPGSGLRPATWPAHAAREASQMRYHPALELCIGANAGGVDKVWCSL